MANNYNSYSKQELIQLLNKRDHERKLGLVWERDDIEHEHTLNNDFVTLELDQKLSVGEAPYRNLLIEGDNFDALRHLNITYRGKVKCIYIDPPYNTGNKDFIYNDHFVDKDHAFRHSLWLEHLYQRLILAKDLLMEDGVMLVSIDDEGRSKLDLLLEQIMPGRRLGSFTWRTKDTGNDAGGNISQVHEHILVYANPGFEFKGKPINTAQYRNPDNDPRGLWRGQPITCNKSLKERANLYYPIQNPETGYWYPCDPDTVWRYSTLERVKDVKKLRSDPIEDLIRAGEIYFPDCSPEQVMQWNTKESLLEAIRNGEGPVLPQKKTPLLREDLPDIDFWVGKPIASGRPSRKHYLNEKAKLTAPVTSWIAGVNEEVAFDNEFEDEVTIVRSPRGREGSDAIKKILGYKAFEFPKPPSLIKHLLEQCTGSDDLILDFYAGSGTTGHATLLLNEEQNANRRFILVSATEASGKEPEKNICRDVCAVRMKRVIEGLGNLPALGGTMAYMRSIRTPMDDLYEDIRHDQIWYTLQQIHFDGISPYQKGADIQVLESEDLRLVYLAETTSTTLAALQEFLEKDHKQTVVYSWQPGVVEQHCLHEHLQIERIPEYLTDRFGGGMA